MTRDDTDSKKVKAVTKISSPITDDDLHSFFDNELDPSRRQSVLYRLAASPADAARIEDWRLQNEALRAAFADILTEPVPASLSARLARDLVKDPIRTSGTVGSPTSKLASRQGIGPMTSIGLAFAAGVATTIAASFFSEHFTTRDLSLSQVETGEPIARRSAEPSVDRTLRAATPIEALPAGIRPDVTRTTELLVVPNLADAGLRLAGIRPGSNSPGFPLCVHYLTVAAVEVTLCVDNTHSRPSTTGSEQTDSSRSTIEWHQKGAKYSMASSSGANDLAALAERARTEIEMFASR
jgi:anti-sigma factor RsiW